MKKKYVRVLEERDINAKTGEIWRLDDVPTTWRTGVLAQIEADGYIVDEDGTVIPRPINEGDSDE